MNRSRIEMCLGLAVATALVLTGSASATGFIPPDSSTWEYSYEGDVNPVDDGWTDVAGGAAAGVQLLSDGGTDYAKFTFGEGEYFQKGGAVGEALDPKTNGGMAYEMRVRVHASAYLYTYLWCTSDSGGPYRRLNTYFTSGNAYHEDSAPPGSDAITGHGNGDWTVLRVVNDNTTVTVYKDSADPTAQWAIGGTDDARTEYFARFYSAGTIDVDVDYLRWTNGVPEPATLGLLTAGGLLLGLRRKRR